MQSLINVLALSSFVVSAAVVGTGFYAYTNKDSLIKGLMPSIPSLPTPDVKIPSPSAPLPVPFPF